MYMASITLMDLRNLTWERDLNRSVSTACFSNFYLRNLISFLETKMSLDQDFQKVAGSVRNWKTTPADSENLALYSLYKQATIGDVNIAEPSGLVEKAKFKAWTDRKGISQDDAKKQYIELAGQLQGKYA
ncbi:hypothetical protein evm_000356 [Chilo suppressalis]|nr:hypothetical protein evm_000356 [Chilo suppressalis]